MTVRTYALVSCANNTKWRELHRFMRWPRVNAPRFSLKWLPARVRRCWHIVDDTTPESPARYWDGEWFYHFICYGDWPSLEWCDLRPATVPDAMTLEEVAETCRHIGLDHDHRAGVIRVFGYRRVEVAGQ